MTLCTEKGFALEVGGLGHPDTPPVILRCADGSTLNDWCKLEEEPERSPRTVYLAPMTPKDLEKSVGLYLQVPGLAAPLLVEENIGQSPYKSGHPAFHDYIFLTFRPMTSWLYPVENNTGDHRSRYSTYADELEYQSIEDEDRKKPTGKFLRRPRDGYFYIFKGQKLWREILYNSAEGRLIDIDLEKYWKIATPSDACPDNLWVDSSRDKREAGPCTETEIWIPAWIKRKECDYSIVYSPVQWSWAHILWRESNGGAAHGRHLSALYRSYMDGHEIDYIDKMENLHNNNRVPRHRFFYQHRKAVATQGSLDQEIIGRARTVVAKAHAASTGIFPSGSTDFEVYKNLAAEYAWEIPQCYAGADGARAAAGDILGDTARYYRGILEIPDPLLSLEILTTRIRFYAHMLNSLTAQVNQKHPAAPILRNMLHNSRMESRGKASMYSKTIHLPPIVKLLLSDVYKAKKYGNQYEILSSMINETEVDRPFKLNLRFFLRKAIYAEQKKLKFHIFNKFVQMDVIEHLRAIFAANGETCVSAYRLVELTLEALQYNALTLDNSITQLIWNSEGSTAAIGADAIDLLFSQKPVLRQFLFPDSLEAYSPSRSLGIHEDEVSTGNGSCRLELLRKIFEAYAAQEGGGAEDIAEKPNPASAAVRVGQLCYDHYCARRTAGGELIIPGAFNLIRLPSAYNDLLLATTQELPDLERIIPLGTTREARQKMRDTVGGAETNYAWRRLSDTARVARKKNTEAKAAPGYLFCYDYELKNSQLTPFAKSAAEVAKGLIDVKSVITSPGSRFMSVVTVWCTLYNAKESWKALDASDSQNVISFGWELLEASGTVTLFFADDLASLLRTVMSSSSKALPLRGFLAETGTVAKLAVAAEKSLTVISVINSSILALKAFSSGQLLPGLAASAAASCFVMVLRAATTAARLYFGLGGAILTLMAELYFLDRLERVLRNCPYSRGTGTLLTSEYDEQETFIELRRLTAPKPVITKIYSNSDNGEEIQAALEDFPQLKGRAPITLLYWELLPDPVVYEIITIHPLRPISWNTIPTPWGIHLYLEHSKTVMIKGSAWLMPIKGSIFGDDESRLKLHFDCCEP